MTQGACSSAPRAGAAARCGRMLLMAAALFVSAPFAASLAARAVADGQDSVALVLICFASGAPDALTGQPGTASDHGIDCVLCQTLCCGFAPLAARPGLVGAAPIQRLSPRWMVADRAAPTRKPRLSNWARAPPLERFA